MRREREGYTRARMLLCVRRRKKSRGSKESRSAGTLSVSVVFVVGVKLMRCLYRLLLLLLLSYGLYCKGSPERQQSLQQFRSSPAGMKQQQQKQ
jgi:hypothetical protein